MAATDILHQIGESLGSNATVKSVFGEPIHTAGKTVIPVAKVAYGFGGGFGTGHGKADTEGSRHGEGGGGGGGVRAFPAGLSQSPRAVLGLFLSRICAGWRELSPWARR
jgi:uncharacterized spore protein YtfJ